MCLLMSRDHTNFCSNQKIDRIIRGQISTFIADHKMEKIVCGFEVLLIVFIIHRRTHVWYVPANCNMSV